MTTCLVPESLLHRKPHGRCEMDAILHGMIKDVLVSFSFILITPEIGGWGSGSKMYKKLIWTGEARTNTRRHLTSQCFLSGRCLKMHSVGWHLAVSLIWNDPSGQLSSEVESGNLRWSTPASHQNQFTPLRLNWGWNENPEKRWGSSLILRP